ncbi:L-cysteine desulfidase family protein [Endozoicomonadaceae bacterium StTr2]
MKEQWSQYLQVIKSVVKPALGCTEPISTAYAAAVAAELLQQCPEHIAVQVSRNLYKNAVGVMVPGTGEKGLQIAAAAGATGGQSNAGLEVLKGITETQVQQARQLIAEQRIQIEAIDTEEFLYCAVTATVGDQTAYVLVSGGHTRLVEKRLNNKPVFQLDENPCSQSSSTGNVCSCIDIDIASIYDFALNIPAEDILFMNEAARLNNALSKEGLDNAYGLEVGRIMQANINKGILSEDLINRIVLRTAAASDARMGGATLPAMSNYGSGNQGIVATIPLIEVAEFVKASDEDLARALAMSHLMAIYIKSHYPPLSAFCGNTVTGSGTAFAMVHLLGGDFSQCCHAMQNVMSDCSGMVCDGAKASCAMKVATAVGAAVRSSLMALSNSAIQEQGIIADEVEQTIRNIGEMICSGMVDTDRCIINIMTA